MYSGTKLADNLPLAYVQYERLMKEVVKKRKKNCPEDRDEDIVSTAVINDCFVQIMDLLGMGTPGEFARTFGMPWVTLDRWLKGDNVPRPSNLVFLGKVLKGEEPMPSGDENIPAYTATHLQARFATTRTKRLWIFVDPETVRDLSGLCLLGLDVEHYFVYPSAQPEAFYRLQRRLLRGEFGSGIGASLLKGKVIGLAVRPNDYPMFISGLISYVAEGDDLTEGFFGRPVSSSDEELSSDPYHFKVDAALLQRWLEYVKQLQVYYETYGDSKEKVQGLEVRYS